MSPEYSKSNLNIHWIIVVAMFLSIVSFIFVCHYLGSTIQIVLIESQRVLFRTVLYVIAIILFPLTNLLRHILLRLNQTMPGETPARNRYLVTVIVTQSMIELVALFGLLMFVLGDGYNTLYIFSTMAVLGIYLHSPKMDEYLAIVENMMARKE